MYGFDNQSSFTRGGMATPLGGGASPVPNLTASWATPAPWTAEKYQLVVDFWLKQQKKLLAEKYGEDSLDFALKEQDLKKEAESLMGNPEMIMALYQKIAQRRVPGAMPGQPGGMLGGM